MVNRLICTLLSLELAIAIMKQHYMGGSATIHSIVHLQEWERPSSIWNHFGGTSNFINYFWVLPKQGQTSKELSGKNYHSTIMSYLRSYESSRRNKAKEQPKTYNSAMAPIIHTYETLQEGLLAKHGSGNINHHLLIVCVLSSSGHNNGLFEPLIKQISLANR